MKDEFSQKVHPMYDDRLWSDFHETTLDARIAEIVQHLYDGATDTNLMAQDTLLLECYNYLYMCARFPAAHITTSPAIYKILTLLDCDKLDMPRLLKHAVRVAQSRAPDSARH